MTGHPDTRPPRVLVVDDYPDAREMYSEYLQFSGFDVIEASNGMEALQRAVDNQPDIILMDLSLPVMDGWEATRRLKADRRTATIPVVALTGHALAGFSDGARMAGCDAFVTKPCLPEDLVKEIRKVLDFTAGSKRAKISRSGDPRKPSASGQRAGRIGERLGSNDTRSEAVTEDRQVLSKRPQERKQG